VLSLRCPSAGNTLFGDFVFRLTFRMGASSKGYLLIRERFLILDQYRLETLSLGQQRLQVIRVRALVPRNSFFGPAAPSSYLSSGSGPSKLFLRVSSAFKLFEFGLWSLETLSSGQQCLQNIRAWASVPRIIFFRPVASQLYSNLGFGPLKSHLLAIGIFVRAPDLQISISGYQRSPLKILKSWWQYTSSDTVCQIRR
jgi:hypothetical protein